VLVDNHSTDATIGVFREWAERTNQAHVIDLVEGYDDTSAKRNHAQSLLMTDWLCWADADDTIYGAHNLRQLAAEAPAELAGYQFAYDYIYDENDELAGSFPRERLIRRGRGTWVGRGCECQQIGGPMLEVDRDVAHA
jgi:glycosyltransferase involved in cell wall biosynthesis